MLDEDRWAFWSADHLLRVSGPAIAGAMLNGGMLDCFWSADHLLPVSRLALGGAVLNGGILVCLIGCPLFASKRTSA